jgi:hypothetical protein
MRRRQYGGGYANGLSALARNIQKICGETQYSKMIVFFHYF